MLIQTQQRLLRWLFGHAENAFNRAFGNALNPFYHLGTIAFWQFWLIFASGLYLYAFADTGVHEAYASVERITHEQWWAGGVLRSVHRYATNGMILTMLLHLLRHFAYDRYRGFRWFSWVSGVALLWMIYVAGINGFMLVWDALAQFIVVAVAEWFDALPLFNGTLIRNFLHQGAVGSRLFTLLAFIHIGVPLLTVLLMWVHVQRVPKAQFNPPRPIALALTLMFVLLALIAPVSSQGGEANFALAPQTLAFDWFELPVLALVYAWGPLPTWAAVLSLTLLAVLAPWLPWRWRKEIFGGTAPLPAEGVPVLFAPEQRRVLVRAGETLLDAGLRADLNLPFACRNGGCGVCQCTVLSGDVDAGVYQPTALPAAERARGKVLLCCATARSAAAITYLAPAKARVVRQYVGRVSRLEPLCHDVMRVVIALPSGTPFSFRAGQYLNILLDDGARRAFSFANSPRQPQRIELHIRRIAGGRFTSHVFEHLRVGDALKFEGPLGDFVLRESTRPIIFVAGATGFAPVKSMVEEAFFNGLRRPIHLYWGVRQRRDLYLPELPAQWAREHANFHFIPVLSEPTPEDHWDGRVGLVHAAILADFPSLRDHEIYACGSTAMVQAVFPHFRAQGADDSSCFSDAFTLAAQAMAVQADTPDPDSCITPKATP